MLNQIMSRVALEAQLTWEDVVVTVSGWWHVLFPARPAPRVIITEVPTEAKALSGQPVILLPGRHHHITSQPMVGESAKSYDTVVLPRMQVHPINHDAVLHVSYVVMPGQTKPKVVVRLFTRDGKPYLLPLTRGNCQHIVKHTKSEDLVADGNELRGGKMGWGGGICSMLITPSAWTMVQRMAQG